jgi:hypothetical protein
MQCRNQSKEMKMKKMMTGLAAFLVLGAVAAQAVEIVAFGTNATYVAADQDLQVTVGADYANHDFDDTTTPLSPASGYTGPTFYGGLHYTNTTGTMRYKVSNYASGDQIYAGTYLSAGEVTYTVVFVKDDFLNGADGGNVSWDATGGSIDLHTSNQWNSEGVTNRWVVKNGSQYYISQATFSPTGTGKNLSFSLSDPGGANWAVYDPSSSLTFDPSGASWSTRTFNDITAVGYYVWGESASGSKRMNTDQFTVDANVTLGNRGTTVIIL